MELSDLPRGRHTIIVKTNGDKEVQYGIQRPLGPGIALITYQEISDSDMDKILRLEDNVQYNLNRILHNYI